MSEMDILQAEKIGEKIGSNGNGKKFDPYTVITNRIVEYFESGRFENWVALWSRTGTPRNASTGRRYNGMNILLLTIRMEEENWTNPLFLTFNQIRALSKKFEHLIVNKEGRTVYPASLKKGSKGESVCFWKRIAIHNREEDEEKTIPLLRLYTVFNVEQLDLHSDVRAYLARHNTSLVFKNDGKRNKAIEKFLKNIGSQVKHGGEVADWSPQNDQIRMPKPETFKDMDAYYSTRFHEEVHRTGHKSRLDRDLTKRFDVDSYAFEELVAELGSSFLCSDFSIHANGWKNQAEYVRVWTTRMRADKHAIFKAASLSNAAVDYLWKLQPEDLRNEEREEDE